MPRPDEVDRCEIIDNVKSGHFFRDPVHSSKALPRDPVASVTVALPEGEGQRSAAIPAQPQP